MHAVYMIGKVHMLNFAYSILIILCFFPWSQPSGPHARCILHILLNGTMMRTASTIIQQYYNTASFSHYSTVRRRRTHYSTTVYS